MGSLALYYTNNIFRLFIISLVFLSIPAQQIVSQEVSDSLSDRYPRPLFQNNDLIKITFSFNMSETLKDVGEERDYHDATFSYLDTDGNPVHFDIKIRTRGHFRRNPANCNFPPLRLDFSDSETKGTLFEDQNKLKLVTHCQTKKKYYEQCLLKEYMVYRLYNIITEESYRVKLAEVTYTDTQGKMDSIVKYGFFLETAGQMAARNGSEEINIRNIHQEKTHRDKIMNLCVFQYMIGNTDWSVPGMHNIELIRSDHLNPPVAVPYDFDWSGIVNSIYAYPAPQLGIESVRERLFRGYCRSQSEYQEAFEFFRTKKDEIYSFCENFTYLDEKQSKRVIRYINDFYTIIDKPALVNIEFYLKCRTD